MASIVKIKRSSVQGKSPTTSNIETGELALNVRDGKLFSTDGTSVFEVGANLHSLNVGTGGLVIANGAMTFPTADGTSGQYLKTDGSGTLSWSTVSSGGGSGDSTFKEYTYTATASQQSFGGADDFGNTLDYTAEDVSVYLNGVLLVANTDYYASNTTSIWLSSGATVDDILQIQSFKAVNVVSVEASVIANTATTTSTSAHVVDSFAAADFRTAKYIVQMTSGSDYHATEALVIHNGTTSSVTEYAQIFTNSSLGTVDTDINSGNVRLLVTPTNATTTVKVVRTGVTV